MMFRILRRRSVCRSGKTPCFYRHSWHANQAYPLLSQVVQHLKIVVAVDRTLGMSLTQNS